MTDPEPRFRDYVPTPAQEAAHQQVIREREERVARIRLKWAGIEGKKKPKK